MYPTQVMPTRRLTEEAYSESLSKVNSKQSELSNPYSNYAVRLTIKMFSKLLVENLQQKLSKYYSLQKRLDTIAALPEDWDGDGAFAFDMKTIQNGRALIEFMMGINSQIFDFFDPLDISPIWRGTLLFDFVNQDDNTLIEVEIGLKEARFYSTLTQPTYYCDSFAVNGDKNDFPEMLATHLRNFIAYRLNEPNSSTARR